jgi:ADP-L-glycero-D-manno-heptose 6-epimerase
MYLVTGGAGFIGSNVVGALAARGERVVVNDCFGTHDNWKNVTKHPVHDFGSPAQLDDWLAAQVANRSRVLGVAPMGAITATTEQDSDLMIASNFQLSRKLWNWCARHRVPFICASSAATYGDGECRFVDSMDPLAMAALRPLNPCGWSKLAFDRRAVASVARKEPAPPQWAGLRRFNVYGPNEYHKGSMRSVIAVN